MRMVKWLYSTAPVVLVTLIMFLYGCATDDIFSHFQYKNEKIGGFTKHFTGSLFNITEKKLYSVELLLWDGRISIGENKVYLIVHNNEDKDVAGADIDVVAKNKGTGSTVKASIVDEGDGLYRTRGLTPDKPGDWEISVAVTKEGRSDRTHFSFPHVSMKRSGGG
jgi:hypothetical protein